MARMISRREAAKLLQITEQSISNWVNDGLLASRMIGRCLRIDKETILHYFDTLQQLGQTEQRVAEMLDNVQRREQALDKRIEDISKAEMSIATAMPRWLLTSVYEAILAVAGKDVLCERELYILQRLNQGYTVSEIVQDLCLTRQAILYIVNKAFKKIYVMRTFSDLRQECRSLKKENADLRQQLSFLNKQLNDHTNASSAALAYVDSHLPGYTTAEDLSNLLQLLSTSLVDMNISVRTLSSLRSVDIYTLKDLVQWQKADIFRIRHIGKKSLTEIEDLLDSLNLSFGLDTDMITSAYYRRMYNKENSEQ